AGSGAPEPLVAYEVALEHHLVAAAAGEAGAADAVPAGPLGHQALQHELAPAGTDVAQRRGRVGRRPAGQQAEEDEVHDRAAPESIGARGNPRLRPAVVAVTRIVRLLPAGGIGSRIG